MAHQLELHGKSRAARSVEGYESPDEYADQGDTRKVRDLLFAYLAVIGENPDGTKVLEPVDVPRDTVVKLDEIGLLALEQGERLHSFYTTEELKRIEAGGRPDQPLAITGGSVSEMGEYELAEYIKGANPEGKELKVQEVLDLVGDDKDLAHRMLMAENIASEGDPRKGVEAGLTSIIQEQGQ